MVQHTDQQHRQTHMQASTEQQQALQQHSSLHTAHMVALLQQHLRAMELLLLAVMVHLAVQQDTELQLVVMGLLLQVMAVQLLPAGTAKQVLTDSLHNSNSSSTSMLHPQLVTVQQLGMAAANRWGHHLAAMGSRQDMGNRLGMGHMDSSRLRSRCTSLDVQVVLCR